MSKYVRPEITFLTRPDDIDFALDEFDRIYNQAATAGKTEEDIQYLLRKRERELRQEIPGMKLSKQ